MAALRWILGLGLVLAGFVLSADANPAALEDPVEVDILKLTSIDWQPGQEVPKEIKNLDGRQIVISGYMQTQFRKARKSFLIVADSCQCTGTPLPHHFVKVTLPSATEYKPGQLTFIGTLAVSEEIEDGFVTSLYRLDGEFF